MLFREWCSLEAAWRVGEDGGYNSVELQRWSEVVAMQWVGVEDIENEIRVRVLVV